MPSVLENAQDMSIGRIGCSAASVETDFGLDRTSSLDRI